MAASVPRVVSGTIGVRGSSEIPVRPQPTVSLPVMDREGVLEAAQRLWGVTEERLDPETQHELDRLLLAKKLTEILTTGSDGRFRTVHDLMLREGSRKTAEALHSIPNDALIAALTQVPLIYGRNDFYSDLLFWLDFLAPPDSVRDGSLLRDRAKAILRIIRFKDDKEMGETEKAHVKASVLMMAGRLATRFDPSQLRLIVGLHEPMGIDVISYTELVEDESSGSDSILVVDRCPRRFVIPENHPIRDSDDFADLMELGQRWGRSTFDPLVDWNGDIVIRIQTRSFVRTSRFSYDGELLETETEYVGVLGRPPKADRNWEDPLP